MRRSPLLLFLVAGCYGVGHRARDKDAAPVHQLSVRFERGEGVTFVPGPIAQLGAGRSADGVLELGGDVLLMTEDSIVISPSYLILPDTAAPGRRAVRLQQQGFPKLAIVRPGPGVIVGPYRWPYPRRAIVTPRHLLGGVLIWWAYYYLSTH